MARIAANNTVIDRITKEEGPDGAGWVACAELVARGIESFSAGGLRLPKLRLPAWHRDDTDEYTVHQCEISGSDHKEKGRG
jgi:hypothetical protein